MHPGTTLALACALVAACPRPVLGEIALSTDLAPAGSAVLNNSSELTRVPASLPASASIETPLTFRGISTNNVTSTVSSGGLGVYEPGTLLPTNLGTFDIVINANASLSSNSAALAAFNRAAAQWEARISDPITITINANLGSLGPSILGSTSTVLLEASYTTIRNAMVADAAADIGDGISASLPTSVQFTASIPYNTTLTGNVTIAKANAKALGFTGLDTSFGVADASITFSSDFTFDFDHSDGVTPGAIDFETVASHEIGHALGFISGVDELNGGATDAQPYTLDLYRFARGVTGKDPTNASEFTSFQRELIPGQATNTDEINAEYQMSTGLTNVDFAGTDGRQASHWKDDALLGQNIGIMDPTLASGVSFDAAESDFRALDLIGYDVNTVPEPTALLGMLIGLGAMVGRRRR